VEKTILFFQNGHNCFFFRLAAISIYLDILIKNNFYINLGSPQDDGQQPQNNCLGQ